jgi:hypothetical protein
MVFEPSRRVVYLAFGNNAASGKFYRFDLNRHFTSGRSAAAPVAISH